MIKNIPIMSSYFDESVFMNCEVFKNYNRPVSVSNGAYMFLLKDVFKINTVTRCDVNDTGYSLNPVNPCAKINIYNLDVSHSRTRDTYSHKPIIVVDTHGVIKPLFLEPVNFKNETEMYDVNENLTPVENTLYIFQDAL